MSELQNDLERCFHSNVHSSVTCVQDGWARFHRKYPNTPTPITEFVLFQELLICAVQRDNVNDGKWLEKVKAQMKSNPRWPF
jgi:hypothetical protein